MVFQHSILQLAFFPDSEYTKQHKTYINFKLKSMSKVVARIARIAIISTFYIEFVFSQLESILVPKKYISY